MPQMVHLRQIREGRSLSRAQLADRVEVSSSTINQLERGIIKEPSYSLVVKLANALEVEPGAFFLPSDTVIAVEEGPRAA